MFKQFRIVSNYSCNNRCKFCYTTSMGFQNIKMNTSNIKKLIDYMYKVGARKCILIGGEPTLHPDLFDIVKYGKDKGLFMKIVTNGRIFKDKKFLKNLVDNGLDFIALSIHGHTPSIDKENTGVENSFEDTIIGIKNCIDLKVPFVTLTTLNKNNSKHIKSIVSFLQNMGVDNIIFNLGSPIEGIENIDKNILNPLEIAKLIQVSYRILKKNKLKAKFYASIPLCLFEESTLKSMIDDEYLIPISGGDISECNVYDGSGIAFDPLGNILTCTHRVKSPVEKILTKEEKLIDFGDFINILKNVSNYVGVENWKYYSEKCEDCHLKDICIGGCELYWNYFSSETYIKGF